MRGRTVAVLAVVSAAVLSSCAVIARTSVAPGGNGEPNGASVEPALSIDGSVTAFASTASNLVPGDTNGVSDVFIRENAGAITRVSVAGNGTEANGPSSHPSISANGRVIAFQSDANNLVANDTNATTDVFVRNLSANTTILASVPAPGAPPPGSATTQTGDAVSPPAGASTSSASRDPLATRVAALRARAAVTPQRVIVRTGTTFRAEGRLTPAERVNQRASIRRDQTAVDTLVGSNGAINARARTLPIVVATVDAAALDRLTHSPDVMSVTADDPLPAALVNSGPVVGLPATQDAGYTGRGVAVAILDTGVDTAHPFFGNRVVDEACYSATSSCPNGTPTQTGTGSALPCTYAPNGCRHGTHVTGIAAGSDLDATGVAPRASIIAVQVFSRIQSTTFCTRGENPCALTFPSDWILGLEHVYELRNTYSIAAVNMSIGGITSMTACDGDAVKPAIDQLRSVGIATVIAAGNEGLTNSIGYPACISSSVSVGATDNADAIASFSNSHPQVSLFAPGVGVHSSVPGGGFANLSGTSMATPHVVGAFALAKEHNPAATVDDILARMKATGRVIHDARNGVDTPRLCTSGALGFDRCPNRNGSRRPSISADGQSVAFESDAPLVAADTNGVTDVYLRSIGTGTTMRVSVTSGGLQGTSASTHPALSGAGTRIAFDSLAPNLVGGDTNGASDVFVRDLTGGITALVSVGTGNVQGSGPSRDAAISADGTIVAFATKNPFVLPNTVTTDVYTADLGNGITSLASVDSNGSVSHGVSRHPSLDTTGRVVAFESDATNLAPNDTNEQTDVFVRDRTSALTQRVSASFFGGQQSSWTGSAVVAPAGGIVAMHSAATDLLGTPDANGAIDVYRRAIVTPQVGAFIAGPIARGASAPFTLTGRGFLNPFVLTSSAGITINVTTVTATQVTGTITIGASVPTGQHNVTIVNLGSVQGFFSATVCPGCLTVA